MFVQSLTEQSCDFNDRQGMSRCLVLADLYILLSSFRTPSTLPYNLDRLESAAFLDKVTSTHLFMTCSVTRCLATFGGNHFEFVLGSILIKQTDTRTDTKTRNNLPRCIVYSMFGFTDTGGYSRLLEYQASRSQGPF